MEGTARESPGLGRRVLVVDDDKSMRRLLADVLGSAGFEVASAPDGPSGLALLRNSPVDLILLDNNMPGMAGIEMLTLVRQHPDTATIPIVLVTGRSEVDERIRGLDAGADDYLVKPFHIDELVARVSALLRSRAAWARMVDARLQERAAIARALAQSDPDAPLESLARVICTELGGLSDIHAVAVLTFTGRDLAIPLAADGPAPWGLEPGRALPVRLARRLYGMARRGPWLEGTGPAPASLTDPDLEAAGTVACAPLEGSDGLIGLLALSVQGHGIEAPSSQAAQVLATAIDFAAIAAGMLGPALRGQSTRLARRRALQDVVRDFAFSTVFQPIVDLTDSSVIGYEALTRFNDGTPPERRFAEAAALEVGIELEAATLAVALEASQALPDGAWLSVNVSPAFVLEEHTLRRLLSEANRSVVLELTEHDRIDDYKQFRGAVGRLGPPLKLSVDDAGSGFASLRHVLALEPNYIKLDRTWVKGVQADRARQALLAGLHHFATETGCPLIAEGVETEAELDTLRKLDVELGQGYYLGRPAAV
jgi:EAL domain-containing protein (putative c-di-GMP-specific phosphodiesterase class I)/DNA-binding NarL/FixJ family response regulator